MSAAQTKARTEAADWLVRRDAGLSAADETLLAGWIAASPLHQQAWAEAVAAWDSFDEAPDDLLEVMRAQALAERPVANDNFRRGLIAASVAASLLLAGTLAWQAIPGAAPAPPRAGAVVQTIATRPGERAVRQLADGTRVTLDSGTTLRIEFDARSRQVWLVKGQADFDVAAAKARPFMVLAADRRVNDIGTRFTVRRDDAAPGGVVVVLEQGLVSVTGPGGRTDLRPGERFRASAGSPGTVDRVDLDQMLAWRDGYLEFQDVSLEEAVAEMNRYGGKQIAITDAASAGLRISGRFRNDDPTGFADAVAALQPVDAVHTTNGIALQARR